MGWDRVVVVGAYNMFVFLSAFRESRRARGQQTPATSLARWFSP